MPVELFILRTLFSDTSFGTQTTVSCDSEFDDDPLAVVRIDSSSLDGNCRDLKMLPEGTTIILCTSSTLFQ
jgi:hypothetical protein